MMRFLENAVLLLLISLAALAQETPAGDGKRSVLANADPNYRLLRDTAPAEAYRVENIELKRDVGTLTLRTGQIVFLPPVLGRVVAAVFVGEGRFRMKPAVRLEEEYLNALTGARDVDEKLNSAVLYFTDNTFDEVRAQARTMPADSQAANVLKDFRRRVRKRIEQPRSVLEGVLNDEDIPNLEVELLGELYNPAQGSSFRAYLHGDRDSDLRFLIVPRGAMPSMPSPEEVALLNFDAGGDREGIWYLSHLQEEWTKNTASSGEDKRTAVAQHFRIETTIARNRHLSAVTEVRFEALTAGERVLHCSLLPTLRVTHVTDESGKELAFIQEDSDQDGSFHIILPEPAAKGQTYRVRIEYQGDKVIDTEGNGNFAVGARTSWYPSLNSFQDRATYDLTFRVPKQFTLVGVGKLKQESKDGDWTVSQWTSEVPLSVAGFNYGEFKKKEVVDAQTKYKVEAYAGLELPDYLNRPDLPGQTTLGGNIKLSPTSMAGRALVDGQNSIRVFEQYFGPAPYGRIAITQQPQFNFGQSWPTLVYLPMSAFLDATQRYSMMGANEFRFAHFIQEVTPHEVAHQWWGHMVGWATYHDQWLSEGFAEFSASLFLEATEKTSEVDKFWDRLRETIVQKNQFGRSPNDAGPLWMGLRLSTAKTGSAYSGLVYPKGAYILHMLRMMMRDPQTGDKDFIAMMHDFVQSHLHRNATSESFRATVEKHMKPSLDAEGNQKMDWFFRDWVYGMDLPRYHLDYSVMPLADGKVLFTGKITQSGVSDGFIMRVPLYFDFDGHPVRAGSATLRGNSSTDIKVTLPKKPKHVLLNANHDVLAAENLVREL
jgi:hypothetical protein